MSVLEDALRLSREGDVDGAARLLRDARAAGPLPDAALTLLFQLVTPDDEAVALAGEGVDGARTDLARSGWALRRGLLHLARAHRDMALADLQLVMKLKAHEGHVDQARVALLRVAQLPKR